MNCLKHSEDSTMALRGIRPEHVEIIVGEQPSKSAHVKLAARVETVEYLGADSLVTLTIKDNRLVARVAGHCRFAPSVPVWVTWHESHQHFFDASNGKRLALKP